MSSGVRRRVLLPAYPEAATACREAELGALPHFCNLLPVNRAQTSNESMLRFLVCMSNNPRQMLIIIYQLYLLLHYGSGYKCGVLEVIQINVFKSSNNQQYHRLKRVFEIPPKTMQMMNYSLLQSKRHFSRPMRVYLIRGMP